MAGTTGTSIVRDGFTADYREVSYWRLGDKRWRSIIMPIVALLSLLPWLFVFGWLGARMGNMPQSGNLGVLEIVLIVAACLLMVVLHETVSIALRYPAIARLIDERDGVRILLPA